MRATPDPAVNGMKKSRESKYWYQKLSIQHERKNSIGSSLASIRSLNKGIQQIQPKHNLTRYRSKLHHSALEEHVQNATLMQSTT
jgi:hypothetical protein